MPKFIEIGAFDGDTNSLTAQLADQGWEGVYVEPIKEYADKCAERHKNNKVTVINKACSDIEGELTLYGEGQVTTGSKDIIANFPKKYISKIEPNWEKETKAQTTTLTKLMEEFGKPDLLVIDAEGMEYDILSECKPLPPIIIVETHEGDHRWMRSEWARENVAKIDRLLSGWGKTILDDCNTRYENPLINPTQ